MTYRAALTAEYTGLRRYALSLTRNPADADDLVQDTMVRALTREAQFEPGTNIKAWLGTIMHNVFIDRRRMQARRGQHLDIEDHCDLISHTPTPLQNAVASEIITAINSLRPAQRVMILRSMRGDTYEAMSASDGVPVGTVRSRLYRAKVAAQEAL